ncbi:MAG: NTP transferase domain-containing protein [Methanobacteriota archaeon]|nr:MAG: NTP transferase domain-containing protein [Euryarchaeota archaeon]
MKGYILTAGEGMRMRPLTSNIPKPLLPVAGKPFLEHNIEAMRAVGIKDIILLVGWKANRVREHLGDGKDFGVRIEYLEQKERLGTAHAISMVEDKVAEPFFCLYGDIVLSKQSVEGMVNHHRKVKGSVMALTSVLEPKRYGCVEVEDGVLTNIVEKPEVPVSNLVNAGAYILDPEIFDAVRQTQKSVRGEYEVTDSFKILLDKKHMFAYKLTGEWIDVARPWDLLEANRIVMADIESAVEGEVSDRAVLKGPVQVGEGTVVEAGSTIVGPAIVGPDCVIGPNAFIRPSTSIGSGCKIGSGTEVKNSIVMNDTKIPHLSYVGDSVIGERCNFGAGTKVANLRLDEHEVNVIVDGRRVGSGRRKLGVIMGDDVKTGINATIDAGCIVGEGTFIGLGAVAKGTISPRSKVF